MDKNNNNNQGNAKIIPLPIKDRDHELSYSTESIDASSVATDRKKWVMSISLMTIIFSVTAINNFLLDQPPSTSASQHRSSRSLASIEKPTSRTFHQDSDWIKHIDQLPHKSLDRRPANIGSAPTTEDRLQFEFLEGKYAVTFEGGKLDQIRFVALSDQPKYLQNRTQFIKNFKDLFGNNFDFAKLKSRTESGKTTRETYTIMAGNEVLSEVFFDLDLHERLINLRVTPSAKN